MRRSYVLAFVLGLCCIGFALRTAWVVSQEPESPAAQAVQPLRSSTSPPPPPPPPPDRNAQLAKISGDERLTGASVLLLLTMLREPDVEVARVAADILKLRVGAGMIVRGDPDSPERAAAVRAVKPFAKALGALLPHADESIGQDLMGALVCVGPAAADAIGAALRRGSADERVRMMQRVHGYSEILGAMVPVITKMLADPDQSVRQMACNLAKSSGSADPALAKALVPFLLAATSEELLAGGDALQGLPLAAGSVVPELRAVLAEGGEEARAMAALVLRVAGEPARAAVPDLMKRARMDDAASVRAACFAALGLIGEPTPALLEVIERGAGDPEFEPRQAAIVAMCELGRPAVPLLSRCLINERASVAEYAIWHLRAMEADLIRGAATDLEDNLFTALANPNMFWEALRLLHEQEADAARMLPHLRTPLASDSPHHRRGALEFVAALGAPARPMLKAVLAMERDGDSTVRAELAYTAACIARDDPVALAFCRRLLKDPEARVRSGAVRGLDEFAALPAEMISELLQAAESQAKWRGVADPKARELLDAFDAKAARAELERILKETDESEDEPEGEPEPEGESGDENGAGGNSPADIRRARAQRWIKLLGGG